MCMFTGDAEVMVCDVSIARVRSAVEARIPGRATYTSVPGKGTLVRLTAGVDPELFRELVERGVRTRIAHT